MQELCEMQSSHLLVSLLYSLWPEEVATNRVISMGQIELNCVVMLNQTV